MTAAVLTALSRIMPERWQRRMRRTLEGCRFGRPSLGLTLFEEGFALDFLGLLIALPFLDRWRYCPHEILEKWGIYLDHGGSRKWRFESIVLCWGRHTKFIHMPWEWRHHSWTVLRPDGTWAKRVQSYDKGEPDGRQIWQQAYRYMLRNGTVQERIATFYVCRGEWRRKWTRWCPWFARVQTCIEVSFDDEVGERTGSWKGGTIGCSYEVLPGEHPVQTLRRMEQTRQFN